MKHKKFKTLPLCSYCIGFDSEFKSYLVFQFRPLWFQFAIWLLSTWTSFICPFWPVSIWTSSKLSLLFSFLFVKLYWLLGFWFFAYQRFPIILDNFCVGTDTQAGPHARQLFYHRAVPFLTNICLVFENSFSLVWFQQIDQALCLVIFCINFYLICGFPQCNNYAVFISQFLRYILISVFYFWVKT